MLGIGHILSLGLDTGLGCGPLEGPLGWLMVEPGVRIDGKVVRGVRITVHRPCKVEIGCRGLVGA